MDNYVSGKNTIKGVNLIDFVSKNRGEFKYFHNTLINNYNPDINGYTLLFMIPPQLSGLKIDQPNLSKALEHGIGQLTDYKYNSVDVTLQELSRFVTFASVDYTPPQEQLNTEKVSSRTGGIPYATEFTMSEQFSVTYVDNSNLDIYNFHQVWIHYIWDLLEGKILPDERYLDFENIDTYLYGALDYVCSFYIVKYKPNLDTITYIGKCIGAFPQSLPSKELIGQRTSNELTTLPFQYFVSSYRSQIINNESDWLYKELFNDVLSKFNT